MGIFVNLALLPLLGLQGPGRPVPEAHGNFARGQVVTIGLGTDLTGEISPWGIEAANGAKLAVNEANVRGGVRGHKVQLMISDTGSRPEMGGRAAEYLIDKGALCLIGDMTSGICHIMSSIAFEKGVPIIVLGTRNDLVDVGANVFRLGYDDHVQGAVMADFAYKALKIRRPVLVTDRKLPYSVGVSDRFRQTMDRHSVISNEVFFEQGEINFRAMLAKAKTYKPDALFITGYFNEAGLIMKQARDMGIRCVFLGTDGWDSTELVNLAGKSADGAYFCDQFNPGDPLPAMKAFISSYRRAYGSTPKTTAAAETYDSVRLVLDAIKRSSALSSEAVMKALDDTTGLSTTGGVVSLKGRNGTPNWRVDILKVVGGRFKVTSTMSGSN